MRLAYSFFIALLTPFLALVMGLKMRDHRLGGRLKERFGFIELASTDVWIHAASVGEIKACSTFIKKLQKQQPQLKISLSTVSCTGYLEAQRQFGDSIGHFFFCFDLPWVWQKVLAQLKPSKLILVEREIWPNLLHQCSQNKISIYLINAKFSQRTQKKAHLLQLLFTPALKSIQEIYSQSETDCQALKEIKLNNCLPTGNLKFDIQINPTVLKSGAKHRESIGSRPIWIAGSTHEEEEDFLIKIHQEIIQLAPLALLIIAPRHPKRFNKVWELCQKSKIPSVRYSQNKAIPKSTGILLLDTLGDLLDFYSAADVCFVAGSINKTIGGHNLLEPAALGKPIVTGVYISEIKQIARLLDSHKALQQCETIQEGVQIISKLLLNKDKAQTYGNNAAHAVKQNQGATQACIDGIFSNRP